MKFSKQLALAGVISTGSLLCATPTLAASIYQNSTSYSAGSSISDLDTSILADDFSLSGVNTTIRSVQWRGRIGSTGTKTLADDFTIQIYSDAGGAADNLLHSFSVGNAVNATVTGTAIFGSGGTSDRYLYSANIVETTLTAGTTYWLSIFNDSTGDDDDSWSWERVGGTLFGGTGSISQVVGDPNWQQASGADYFFSLDDASVTAVPVPAAVWLMGSALAGLFGFSRKQKATV